MALQDAFAHKIMLDNNKFLHCIKCGRTVGIAEHNKIERKMTVKFREYVCKSCGEYLPIGSGITDPAQLEKRE